MKSQVAFLMILIVCSQLVSAADLSPNTSTASAKVAPLLAQMGPAANAHDVERHVGFYVRGPRFQSSGHTRELAHAGDANP
jgi:hypothetical protein